MNTRKELRRSCSPIGYNHTKLFWGAQTGASIRLTVWKWSGESQYAEALPPILENFRRAFSLDLTDCPWVSEDDTLPNAILKRTVRQVYLAYRD